MQSFLPQHPSLKLPTANSHPNISTTVPTTASVLHLSSLKLPLLKDSIFANPVDTSWPFLFDSSRAWETVDHPALGTLIYLGCRGPCCPIPPATVAAASHNPSPASIVAHSLVVSHTPLHLAGDLGWTMPWGGWPVQSAGGPSTSLM